ncbi:MAG: alpha/beta hydrolase [Ruminococcus sp.]|nr:alpha/beta hydrolase [Ruminococcus sp.]
MYFTLSDGMKIYYEDTEIGDEILIMMHGVTSNHLAFEKPVEILREKFRCITFDQRGHCNSKGANKLPVTMETLADDLHELIEGLSLKNVNLFGWSMGAGVAMTYVKKYGCENLKKLILCDMTPRQLNDESWDLGLDRGRYDIKAMKKAEKSSFKKVSRDFMRGVVPKLRYLPFFMVDKFLMKVLSECDEGVIMSLFDSMKLQDNRDFISKVTVPLAYVYARPGSLFLPKLAEWYGQQARFAGLRYKAVGIENSSHLLIYEHPEEFAKVMSELI